MINLKIFQKIQFTFSVFIFLFIFTDPAFSQPKVEKVEPPNWWTKHSFNSVRLLVRGENFQHAKVSSANESLKISNIKVNQNSTYLFFDVAIAPHTKPARYEFRLETQEGKTIIPFEVLPPLKSAQSVTNDDIIYLIMTDRFADGDLSNNNDIDKNNPRGWHGGDFRGVINRLDYLKELGVTALWLTPWYDNSDEIITCDKPWCPMTSYHGYGAIDLYGVENHFGSMDDLQELIRQAKSKGIKVIQDQVANHVSFRHQWMKNPPLADWFTPFVPNTFNNSVLLSPNGSPAERDNLLNGWFDFSLPDMNYNEPEVARYEIQNALWWIGTTGISGVRQDTIQYMPRKFINEWSSAILKQYPNFYLVGEVKKEDSAHTAFFQGGKTGWDGIDTRLPSVFDFKLWETSQEVFTNKKPMQALRDVLVYDGLYPNINNVTTLTGNHDTDRFMSLPNAANAGAKLHIAFILAVRGIPQLYYGDEVLMPGGFDPDNRRDFTKFARSSRTVNEQDMFEWTQSWIKLRKDNLAVREGKTVDLFYSRDCYVFMRTAKTSKTSNSVIFAFNNAEQEQEIEMEIPADGVNLKNLIVEKGTVGQIVRNKIKLKLMPKSANAFCLDCSSK